MTMLRHKLAARAEHYLEPGEQIQQTFLAQSGPNPNIGALTWLIALFTKYWIVVVTNRSIVVLAAKGALRQTFPKAVAQRLPRSTQLGPTSGALWSKINLFAEKNSWVHRRFYHDVAASDDEIGSAIAGSAASE